MDLVQQMTEVAQRAACAAERVAQADADVRDGALMRMAAALREEAASILAANALDVSAAREAGLKDSLIDRLALDEARLEDMASALEDLTALSDPVGRVLEERTLDSGIRLRRVSVPLGVVCVIYEARPNVTADAAGICLKAGNACILRGGSSAARSNAAIAEALARAAVAAGLPEGSIQAVTTADRAAADALMQLHGLVDVIIPRGGAGLIQHCVETSKVPVIETGTGNCHVYVHESADAERAVRIVENAKCRRYGVCNAAETLLIDEACAPQVLPPILGALTSHGVRLHLDEASLSIAQEANAQGAGHDAVSATEEDWATEYLAPEIAVKCVVGVDAAVEHINRYGTRHSEAIVAEDADAIQRFLRGVDAAAVYANASTAFTDGAQFGLGAEIGISTQKLHARGPFAADALTSHKYILEGSGQVRD